MFYRCLNDVAFGYCNGEPEFEGGKPKMTEIDGYTYAANNTCKLDKATCGRYGTTHCSKEIVDA